MTTASDKAKQICSALIAHYGNVIAERKMEAIDELVLTILSQSTNDVNMFRAYHNLKATYPNWNDVLNAPEDELGEVIKSSGFFRVKAHRIKATLEEVRERVGRLDLSHLEQMSTEDATKWLVSLHGVGPKTAAIVLLFCFGRPTLPVDTHVWRVTKRLGLVSEKATRESAQKVLEGVIPASCIYSMNHNLIKHGREVCMARNPKCNMCFLRDSCSYYQKRL